jgi:hypothetical protein
MALGNAVLAEIKMMSKPVSLGKLMMRTFPRAGQQDLLRARCSGLL